MKNVRMAAKDRPIVNIDVDGVLYDFNSAFRDYASEVLGRDLVMPTTWSFWKEWDINQAQWTRLFRDGVHVGAIWLNGRPISGAFDGMWRLSDSEYHVRLLTTRLVHDFDYEVAVTHTASWLRRSGIPYRSLSMVGHGESKASFPAIALVDDKIGNITEWVEVDGNIGIVFDQPWNRELAETPNIWRASSWGEVTRLVVEAEEAWLHTSRHQGRA